MALFCFDFNHTLVKGNFFKKLKSMGVPQGKATPDIVRILVDDPKIGLKNKDEYLQIMRSAIQNGHYIAITSDIDYPEVIEPTLKAMGLKDNEISKINKQTFLPDEQGHALGKLIHIEKAIKHFKLPEETLKSSIWLVDDDKKNIRIAQQIGFSTVLIPKARDAKNYIFANKSYRKMIELANSPS